MPLRFVVWLTLSAHSARVTARTLIKEPGTWRCLICKFAVPLDDAVCPTERGTCVCVACYHRETESDKPMGKALRKALQQTVDSL